MFKEIYNNYLIKSNEQNQVKRKEGKTDGWFSASSAGSCYKKQYYLIVGEEPTNTPSAESLAKMRLGTLIHADFEDAMRLAMQMNNKEDVDFYTEYAIKIEDLKLEGTLDMAVHDKNLNQLFVADLKSIASYPYKLRFGRDKAKNRNRVSTNYELQVCTYAIALSNELEQPNVIPMLVFYNKDTSRIKTIEINQSFMDEALFYWQDLNDLLDDMGADMADVEPNSMVGVPNADWECGYCQFQDKCKGML